MLGISLHPFIQFLFRFILNMSQEECSEYYIFVYGTLKRGQPNNIYLMDQTLGKAKFIGKAVCLERLPLVIYSQYNIPFLLDCPGTGEQVEGEVYQVDDRMLKWMDDFEEHPTYYLRSKIQVQMCNSLHGDSNEIREVWTYILPKYHEKMLKLPFIKCYDTHGDHGLPYVESEETRSLPDN